MIKLSHYLVIIIFLASTLINVAEAKQVTFKNGDDLLSGHYLLPDSGKPRAVILFVHGDGPLGYDAHGYYPLIWEHWQLVSAIDEAASTGSSICGYLYSR
jgi:hypothetical protein